MVAPALEGTIGRGVSDVEPERTAHGEARVSSLRVALVQLAADQDVAANVDRAAALVRRAGRSDPRLVALPEDVPVPRPGLGSASRPRTCPAHSPSRSRTGPFSRTWILLGSLAETLGRFAAALQHVGPARPTGQIAARYRKRHLFDVAIDGGPSDRESSRITPGDASVIAVLKGAAQKADVRLGLSICFDLRFPELYRELALDGAVVMSVPATSRRRPVATIGSTAPRPGIETGPSSSPRSVRHGGRSPDPRPQHDRRPVGDRRRSGPRRTGDHGGDLDLERVVAIRRQLPTQPTR